MTLLIDTSKREARVALTQAGGLIDEIRWEFAFDLLERIDELLQANDVQLGDLQKIEVHPGPGHFSALRSGIVTATMLAEALNIELADMESGKVVEVIEPVY